LKNTIPFLSQLRINKGEQLYCSGDFANEFYFIEDGRVKLFTEDDVHFQTFIKGDVFGEYDTVLDRPRLGSAVAAEDTCLLVLSKNHFDKVMLESHQICFKLIVKSAVKRELLVRKMNRKGKKAEQRKMRTAGRGTNSKVEESELLEDDEASKSEEQDDGSRVTIEEADGAKNSA